MELVSSSHSSLAFHQTPSLGWRFRNGSLGTRHAKSVPSKRTTVVCVGSRKPLNSGDSGKVQASHGFYASDADLASRGIRKRAGEIKKVAIPGLPEGPECSPISSGFWEWKPKLTVHYEKAGMENSKAPVVLFLPGFGVGTFHFEKQLRDLGREYRVWTMDFLGQGMSLLSEDPAPNGVVGEQDGVALWGFGQESEPWAQELVYSVDLWCDQVRHFIREVIREPVYLVGNSLGGFVSLHFAASNPDLVKGITLLNATPFWGLLPNPY